MRKTRPRASSLRPCGFLLRCGAREWARKRPYPYPKPQEFGCGPMCGNLYPSRGDGSGRFRPPFKEETLMKTWNKPQVSEQVVGLEVTSYMPAEIDII